MKKIYLLTKVCFFAAMMFFAAACTEDDAVVTPIFPEGETVETVVPGTEYTLTFSANMNWELESSKLWFVFTDNNSRYINGNAGDISLSLKMIENDPTWTVDDETAEITLRMGDEEKVIARFTRAGLPLSVKSDNEELNEIAFEYSVSEIGKTLTFSTNFDWEITESPEWLIVENMPIKGTANGESSISLKVNPRFLSTDLSDKLIIRKQNSEKYYEIPVTAQGIPEGKIRVEGVGSGFNWSLSADGSTFSAGNVQYNVPFTFYVVSKNNDYKIISVSEIESSNGQSYLYANNEYFKFYDVKDNEIGEVTIDNVSINESKERKGFILVMSNEAYNDIMTEAESSDFGLDGVVLNDDASDINLDCEEYISMAFTQDESEVLAGGFDITRMGKKVACGLENQNSDFSNYINETYKIEKNRIYTATTWTNSYLTINPKLSTDEWNESNMKSNMKAIYLDDKTDVDISSWEPLMSQDETNYVVNFRLSNRPMVILFKNNSSSSFEKALILNVEE